VNVGFAILAHVNLHRAGQLARALADWGAPVALHVDARAPEAEFAALREACADRPRIALIDRRPCEWGMFSLVEATLDCVSHLLQTAPGIGHVCLLSGACLPIRPLDDLSRHLRAGGPTDYIESNDIAARRWVQGGLAEERFTLHFPYSWKRQRRLFDLSVRLQRRLGIRRRLPAGLMPHIGSQWWCLSRATLEGILNDPRKREFDDFFARSWIPDETYFQTLVRRHALRIENRSLTLNRFDHQGKPYMFYDDHQALLEQTDHFFARKIWSGADGLYAHFLDPDRVDPRKPGTPSRLLERPFQEAMRIRCEGRPGLLSQSRFPCRWFEAQPSTPAGYVVFDGFDALIPGWHRHLGLHNSRICHGRLFARDRVEFHGDMEVYRGNIPANPRIRDRAPEQFLLNLLRQDVEFAPVTLQFRPADSAAMARFFRRDPRARILRLEDAWLIELYRACKGDPDMARKLIGRSGRWPDAGTRGRPDPAERATVESWPLADALARPERLMRKVMARVWPEGPLPTLPEPRIPRNLPAFAAALGHPAADALAEATRERAVRDALYTQPLLDAG